MTRRNIVPLLVLHASLASPSLAAGELIDPTRPQTGAGKSPPVPRIAPSPVWVLESTLVALDRRVAVINGEPVSEGESIDGARVIEIRALDVLIQTRGGRVTLQLLPDIVREGS